MERGDTGLGRDAYGLPRRERDRRGYGPEGPRPHPPDDGYPAPSEYEEDDAAGPGGPLDEEDDYGQLLRRPGEVPPRQQRLRQPGRPHPGQPGRYPPNAGPGNGALGNGALGNGGMPGNAMPNGPMPGRPYRLRNGRRMPPGADRLYRPPGPSTPGGTSGRHHGPGPAGQDPQGGSWSRTPGPSPGPGPGTPIPGGPIPDRPIPGPAQGDPYGGAPRVSGVSGFPPLREHPPKGRFEAPDGRERLGPPPESVGPVIRQRENAVPGDRPGTPAQPVASIAPDGLEAFARDLRALRAKADLDYPEMAKVSHYEMKTLAAAAGGLRLPSLPVAVAFVRACDGDVAGWEERWQKLAEKITADAAKKRRNDGDEHAEPLEPADAPAVRESPARKPAPVPTPEADPGEVYVITSARPRPPGW